MTPKRSRSPWPLRYWKSLRWNLHCRYPSTFSSSFDSTGDIYKKRDPEDNQASRLPTGEIVRTPIVWGAEVYGPSEIDALYENLERLGWNKGRHSLDVGVISWISEQRTYGTSGTYNIGFVTRKDETRYLFRDHFAALPSEVDYLIVQIHQLSTSLTCLLVGFVLTDEASCWYERELESDRETVNEPLPRLGSFRILRVEDLKRRSVDQARASYRSLVARWFVKEVPGFFSGADNGKRLPTAELIETSKANCIAFNNREPVPRADWRGIILWRRWFEGWSSTRCPALRLLLDNFDDDMRYHAVAAIAKSEVAEKDLQLYGGSIVAYCETLLSGTLAHNAAVAWLREANKGVKLSRERLKSSSTNKTGTMLETIAGFFTFSAGLPAVAEELRAISEKPGWYEHYCEDFTSRRLAPEKDSETLQLPDAMRKRTNHLAENLLRDEASLREQFEQFASVLSVRESLKAQRRMEWLTVGAFFVALMSLLATLPPVKDWPGRIETLLEEPSDTHQDRLSPQPTRYDESNSCQSFVEQSQNPRAWERSFQIGVPVGVCR